MSCDGPRYGHMEEQRIVALIYEYNKKEAGEGVETKMMFPKHPSFHSLTLKPSKKWMIAQFTVFVNQKPHQKVCTTHCIS